MSTLSGQSNTLPGTVTFISAGPGAADLLTIRGMRSLASADVVLYDALVDHAVLDYCAAHTIKLPVGKRDNQPSMPQPIISQLLVESAKKHTRVVRLKGGDVSLFGRLDEELAALNDHNIAYEIVPGVSSAFAAAASIAKPLTQRGVARSVAFVTGHTLTTDLPAIPNTDNVIVYMGRRNAQKLALHMIHDGRSPETPITLIANVSLADEHAYQTTLQAIADNPEDVLAHIKASAPLLWMIGESFVDSSDRSMTNEETPQHSSATALMTALST